MIKRALQEDFNNDLISEDQLDDMSFAELQAEIKNTNAADDEDYQTIEECEEVEAEEEEAEEAEEYDMPLNYDDMSIAELQEEIKKTNAELEYLRNM